MKLTILGCYAATPRTFTNPTAQVLEVKNDLFLIDCAEGTQVQLRKNKVKFSKINTVFISHLHGDHFFGLIGLISTFSLLNRTTDLHIFGPKGIQEIIKLQLKLSNSWPQFDIQFTELVSKESEVIFENKKVTVKSIPLKHRVYTNGFLFEEKQELRKLNPEAATKYKIEKCYFQNIKNGKDIMLDDGRLLLNKELSFDPPACKSYAFCSDTVFDETIIPILKNVDTLYHEATFLESENALATKTMHSTAKQAATIALKANAKQLILGHYSTRYESIEAFKTQAQEIFENVILGNDGLTFEI